MASIRTIVSNPPRASIRTIRFTDEHVFKTPRFLVLYLLLQSEIPGRPYRRSANQAIRKNDAMHHSATGECAISSMILAFRPPGSIRDPACIWDPASIRGNAVHNSNVFAYNVVHSYFVHSSLKKNHEFLTIFVLWTIISFSELPNFSFLQPEMYTVSKNNTLYFWS